MASALPYFVYAPSYYKNDGGCIVMHQLCHHLNEIGATAYLFPMERINRPGLKRRLREAIMLPKFLVNPSLNTPVAGNREQTDDAIVIYPEIIPGNPVGAKNVVRWLLHKPGYHTGLVEFGKDELFFKFDDFCEDETITGGNTPQLLLFSVNPLYKNLGYPDREGSCYLIRKGGGKPMVHDVENSIKIDDLPHEEVVEIFNRCTTFYSYDDATMYTQFAAMCGCDSIVIPDDENVLKEDWIRMNPLACYGAAYGLDDFEHARKTKHLVSGYLKSLEDEGVQSVKNFDKIAQKHFGKASG